jgi:hypothetical protein
MLDRLTQIGDAANESSNQGPKNQIACTLLINWVTMGDAATTLANEF